MPSEEDENKPSSSNDEHQSDGDFIEMDDIIVLPDDLDTHLKGLRPENIGTRNQLSKEQREELARRRRLGRGQEIMTEESDVVPDERAIPGTNLTSKAQDFF